VLILTGGRTRQLMKLTLGVILIDCCTIFYHIL
jgi:hypothetical protein